MDKRNQRILQASGLINVFFFFSHVMFYTGFEWEKTLACLSRFDRAIFMTYHGIVILTIGAMAVLSLFYARHLLTSTLGQPVLLFFALFYLLRIAAEFAFFGYSGASSILIIVLCLLPVAAWLYAFCYNWRLLRKIAAE